MFIFVDLCVFANEEIEIGTQLSLLIFFNWLLFFVSLLLLYFKQKN